MEIILKIENNNFSLKKYLSFSASMHFYDMRIKWSPIRELFFAHIALHLKYQKLKVSQNFHEIFFSGLTHIIFVPLMKIILRTLDGLSCWSLKFANFIFSTHDNLENASFKISTFKRKNRVLFKASYTQEYPGIFDFHGQFLLSLLDQTQFLI